jgi:antitoxin component of MazEF toxin-antitoxin module
MLEAVGRVHRSGRSTVIRIPKDVAVDSAFPFQQGEEVTVQIVDGELRVVAVLKRQVEVAEILSKQ